MKQLTAWGPGHLFRATPKWASKAVSCMATLMGVWPLLVAAYPHLIPVDVQLAGAKIAGACALGFQMFGVKAVPDAGVLAETTKITGAVSEDEVRAMIQEIVGGNATPAGDEPAEEEVAVPAMPVAGTNAVIGPLHNKMW